MYIQIVFKSGRIKEYTSPKAWIEDNKFISAAGEYNIEEDKIMRISFSDTKFENFLENPSINDSWVNKITDAQIEKFVLNIMKVSGIGEIYRDDTDTHEVIVELLSKDGYRKDVIHFGLNDITSTYNYVNVYPYISRWKEYLNSLHISCENI